MQIKRFEASDMTEALRLVKREFGEEAVILSAKEIGQGGLFNAWRKKHVEITAATDRPLDDAPQTHSFSKVLSDRIGEGSAPACVSLAEKKKSKSLQIRCVERRSPSAAPEAGRRRRTQRRPIATGQKVADIHAGLCASSATRGTPEAGAVKRWLQKTDGAAAATCLFGTGTRRVIAMVGPSGAGKSTAIAKLAWQCHVAAKRAVGLISLDRYHVNANGLLSRVAQIMNLPLVVAHDAQQLRSALNAFDTVDVTMIDTPGMGFADRSMLEDARSMLQLVDPDEIHLVINATTREEILAAYVRWFGTLDVNRLLLTHLDQLADPSEVWAGVKRFEIPASFYGDGVDVRRQLNVMKADRRTVGGDALQEAPDGGTTATTRNRTSPQLSLTDGTSGAAMGDRRSRAV